MTDLATLAQQLRTRAQSDGALVLDSSVMAADVAEADGHDLDEIAEAASLHPDFVASLVHNSTDQRRQVRI